MLNFTWDIVKIAASIVFLSFWKFIKQTYSLLFSKAEVWIDKDTQSLDPLKYMLQVFAYNFIIFKFFSNDKSEFIKKIVFDLNSGECGGLVHVSESFPKLLSNFDFLSQIIEKTSLFLFPIIIYSVFKPLLSRLLNGKYVSNVNDIVFYSIALFYVLPGFFWNIISWRNYSKETLMIIQVAQLILCSLFFVYKMQNLLKENLRKVFCKIFLSFFVLSCLPVIFKITSDFYIAHQVLSICSKYSK